MQLADLMQVNSLYPSLTAVYISVLIASFLAVAQLLKLLAMLLFPFQEKSTRTGDMHHGLADASCKYIHQKGIVLEP